MQQITFTSFSYMNLITSEVQIQGKESKVCKSGKKWGHSFQSRTRESQSQGSMPALLRCDSAAEHWPWGTQLQTLFLNSLY